MLVASPRCPTRLFKLELDLKVRPLGSLPCNVMCFQFLLSILHPCPLANQLAHLVPGSCFEEVRRLLLVVCTASLKYIARSCQILFHILFPPELVLDHLSSSEIGLRLRSNWFGDFFLCVGRRTLVDVCGKKIAFVYELYFFHVTASTRLECFFCCFNWLCNDYVVGKKRGIATELSTGPSIGGRSFEPAAIILLCIWLSVEDVFTGVDMMND
ncbi:hypothetical protein Tco_0707986 [Tanacetum coccineum]